MSQKMLKCKSCGNDIASSAKSCPNCGAKNKKPIFKKWWFWLIIAFVFIFIIAMAGGDSEPSSSSSNNSNTNETSISVSADELIREYVNNSVSADEKYKGKNVTVSGTIYSIEDGYIVIEPDADDLWLNHIYAYYSSNEKSKLGNYSKGDRISMTGECKGEGFVGDVELRYCVIN